MAHCTVCLAWRLTHRWLLIFKANMGDLGIGKVLLAKHLHFYVYTHPISRSLNTRYMYIHVGT